jgi:hypothetical protein
MDEIWSGDRAVLTKVVELYESTGEYLEPQRVLDAFPEEQCDTALQSLRRLSDSGHIKAVTTQGMGQRSPQLLIIKGVSEKGLRASGAWPSDAELLADRILAVLAERTETEPEPEKRSKLQAGLKGVGEMTRDVLVEVLGTALAKGAGVA